MWEFLTEVLVRYGLSLAVTLIVVGALGWAALQLLRATVKFKSIEHQERLEQSRRLTASVQEQQTASNHALVQATEIMTRILDKVELLERELHDDMSNDGARDVDVNALVSALPKHADDCATANEAILNALNGHFAETSKILNTVHKDLIVCKTLLESGKGGGK